MTLALGSLHTALHDKLLSIVGQHCLASTFAADNPTAGGTTPFVATKIYITSSKPAELVYCRQNETYDGINQLMRGLMQGDREDTR
jgi:hypothetical protein